jgi:hypothetical protein
MIPPVARPTARAESPMKEQLSHARALLTRLNEASDGAVRRLEVLAARAPPP